MKNRLKKLSALALGTLAVAEMKINTFAVSVNANADVETVGGSVLDKIGTIVSLIGGGIALFGIVSLGLAISNPDSPPEKKTQGIACIIGGGLVAGATVFLKAVGVLA